MKGVRNSIMGFNKRNIKRGNNTIGRGMPAAISFGMGFIPDEGATKRACLDFRGMSLKKDIGLAAYFVEVRNVRFMAKP